MNLDPRTSNPKTPFELLQFRVTDAHWRWKVWKQLYMGNPTRPTDAEANISLMNDAAPAFFKLVYDALLQDVALRLCKLVDAEKGGPKKQPRRNFSLAAALVDAKGRLSPPDEAQAATMLASFKAASEPLIKWRHWVLAHDDYEVAIGAHKPPKLTDTHIEEAMIAATQIMRMLDPNAANCEYLYDEMISNGDGESLLHALKQAAKYKDELRARHRASLASQPVSTNDTTAGDAAPGTPA